ncbi:MAG: dihydrolipoamide acetyltransferase [Myxococcus sp.]|nr:dihydrolipoamide acetyltransferase [Myxococcus sp.]
MISRRLVGLAAALVCLAPALAQTPAPGGAAPSPESAGSAAAAPAPQTADEAFQTRVKQLEEQVVDLKEKIFRTKARLLLLQETVLGGDISQGARAIIYHRKEMSPQFVLESVAYALDGAPIFTKVDTNDDLNKREEFEIFNGRIVPGNHQIAVRMVYRGAGGVFSYAEGYKFKLQSNQTFTAEGGKITTVKVVGFEKGGITAEMKDKPGIRYDISSTKEQAGSNASSGDQSAPGAATNPQ